MKNIICFFLAFFCAINILHGQSFGTAELAKAQEEADKIKISEEFRDSQKGILVSCGISFGGFNFMRPKVYPNTYLNKEAFDGLRKAVAFRATYVKESILPFGGFLGCGLTNVFYSTFEGGMPDNLYMLEYTNDLHPFIDVGVSKNLGTSFTVELGYRHIFSGEKTEEFPVYYEEKAAITSRFVFRQKKTFFTLGTSMYLPYYDSFLNIDSEWGGLYVSDLPSNLMFSLSYGLNF